VLKSREFTVVATIKIVYSQEDRPWSHVSPIILGVAEKYPSANALGNAGELKRKSGKQLERRGHAAPQTARLASLSRRVKP